MPSTSEALPLDYEAWRKEWNEWRNSHAAVLKTPRRTFQGRNFLADDYLGTFNVNGRTVELSGVTFPNLSERDPATGRLLDHNVRMIGITYGIGTDASGAVVTSWEALEAELGI